MDPRGRQREPRPQVQQEWQPRQAREQAQRGEAHRAVRDALQRWVPAVRPDDSPRGTVQRREEDGGQVPQHAHLRLHHAQQVLRQPARDPHRPEGGRVHHRERRGQEDRRRGCRHPIQRPRQGARRRGHHRDRAAVQGGSRRHDGGPDGTAGANRGNGPSRGCDGRRRPDERVHTRAGHVHRAQGPVQEQVEGRLRGQQDAATGDEGTAEGDQGAQGGGKKAQPPRARQAAPAVGN